MSEYYKQMREIICGEYKYLGISIKFERGIYTVLAVISFVMAIILIVSNKKTGIVLLIYLVLACVSSLGSLWSKRKYRLDRKNAISNIIDKMNIDEGITNLLIKEIEGYIKQMQVFATWFIGITVTFVILFITIFTDYFFKYIDTLINLENNDQVTEWIVGNLDIDTYIFTIIKLGGDLIIIVILFILLFYNIFNVIIYAKKEILYFLHDVRYQLLMTDTQKQRLEEEINKTSLMNKFNFYNLLK